MTAEGVLRKQDVPAAAAVIGVKAPQAVRSAADLPELHVAWCAAIGMGLLTAEGGKVSGGPELKNWPPSAARRAELGTPPPGGLPPTRRAAPGAIRTVGLEGPGHG